MCVLAEKAGIEFMMSGDAMVLPSANHKLPFASQQQTMVPWATDNSQALSLTCSQAVVTSQLGVS